MTVSANSLKLLVVGLTTVGFLTGCATAKVGDTGKMKSATPATVALKPPTKTVIGSANTGNTTATTTSSGSTTEAPKKKKKKAKPIPILDDVYVVKEGDNLWCISKLRAIYDDAYMWPLIYKRNMATIKDPDLIYPGQRLWIERDNSNEDIEAAVNHARTRGAWSVGPTEASDLKYIKM